MIHIPILRAGRTYYSLETATLTNFETGETVAIVSQANPGLIAHDLNRAAEYKRALDQLKVVELLDLCKKAAIHFGESKLALGEETQTPEEYIAQISSTTGMPQALCKRNVEKIRFVLANMEEVLQGLTRGLDFNILDEGYGTQEQRAVSFFAQTNALGAILPNNSPGVHSLWLPAIPLKVPLVLRPGGQEPWTPFRIAQAFLAAGIPPQAFSFYPSSYAGASEILMRTGRSVFFGDASSIRAWQNDPKIQIHGPGWSKVILGKDAAENWEQYIDVIATSISENGGRSCLNASSVWVPSHGREIAEALAQRFARIKARSSSDPEASIAAFSNPKIAERISDMINRQLKIEGAEDVTLKFRQQDRLVKLGRATYLLPTIIFCTDPTHPLANSEFLFPFATVVEVPQEDLLSQIGPTLVATAITEDAEFTRNLLACQRIDRLNLGVIPTSRISWNQPHEGNLFEHLYKQRAFQSKLAPLFSPETAAGRNA
ncbi:MAG TPA: aldehyde dehydrogenase family protein [Acidobacteriota bacterium]|nr:aldehyde dehydrogenase family protein [Acidobacteriota bacterium]